MRKLYLLFSLLSLTLSAQHELWVGLGGEYGLPVGGDYTAQKNTLYSRYSATSSGSIFLQYRLAQRFGIDFGLSQMFAYHHLRERRFREEHDNRFDADIKMNSFYTSWQGSLQYRQPLDGSYAGLYGSLGYRMNHVGNNTLRERRFFQPDNTDISYQLNYKGNYASVFSELGVQILTDDEMNMFTIALHYELGMKDMVVGYLNVNRAGEPAYRDRFAWSGNYIGIALKYHFKALEIKAKRIKKDNTVVSNNQITYVVRTTVVKQTIDVKTKKVKVTIVEQYREDNDIVSVQLNGNWVVKNKTVTQKPYTFEIELYPGRNELIFVAENLGDIPPNTATVFVEDGGKKHKVDFMGTMERNESIIINYQP